MVMRGHVRFQTQRAMVKGHFFEDTEIEERLDVLVNGTQGNGRDALANLFVDQLGSGMFVGIDDGFVDDLALEGKGEALFFTAPAEVVEDLRTQV